MLGPLDSHSKEVITVRTTEHIELDITYQKELQYILTLKFQSFENHRMC